MWFWFYVTPGKIAYYLREVIYPSLGTTALMIARILRDI